ncbi:Uncharacterised protein [Chlamydia abortus]|nr:Uncharacterised protein [Chlamydia abortus]
MQNVKGTYDFLIGVSSEEEKLSAMLTLDKI